MSDTAGLSDQKVFQLESPVPMGSGDLEGIDSCEMEEICSPEIIQLTEDTQRKLRLWLLNTPIFQGLDSRIRALYERSEVEKWISKTPGNPRHISFRPTAPTPDGVVFRASTRNDVSARLEALFLNNFPRAKEAGVDLDLSYYVRPDPFEKKKPAPAPVFGVIPQPSVVGKVDYYRPPEPFVFLHEELLKNEASGVYFIHQPAGSGGGAEEIFLLEAQRIAKAHGITTDKLSCSNLKRSWMEVGSGKAHGDPIYEAFSRFYGKDCLIILEHAESFFRKTDGNLSGVGTIEKVMEQLAALLKRENNKTIILFVGTRTSIDLIRAARGVHEDIVSPIRGAAIIGMRGGEDSPNSTFSYDSQEVRRSFLFYHLGQSLSQAINTAGLDAIDLFMLEPQLVRHKSALFVSEGISRLVKEIKPITKLLKKITKSESLFDIGSLSSTIFQHEADCDFDSFFSWLDDWIVLLLKPYFPELQEEKESDEGVTVGQTLRSYLVVSSIIHLCANSYEKDLFGEHNPLSKMRERIFRKIFSSIPGISTISSLDFSIRLSDELNARGVSESTRYSLLNTVFTLGSIPYGKMNDWYTFLREASEQICPPDIKLTEEESLAE